jgi:predicted membrane protein
MRTLLKPLLLLIGGMVVTRLAGLVVSRHFEEGREVSDEFRRMVCFDGLQFTSRAGGLRNAEVSVVLGGAKVDLRNAVIDPAGATILLENTLGGLVLNVRDDWAVTVDDVLVGGGETEVRVTSPDELPADAPKLRVRVITRLGGTVITTGDGGM